MSNTNLTVDQITNEALMILHQKLNFIGTINRQYDDSYKTSGAKGGESIRIRLPNKFTVRSGKTLNTQDVTQKSVTLTTGTQKGVDMNFSSQELTQDINLFAKNFLDPAMSVLASVIENDMISNVYKDVYNEISEVGVAGTLIHVLGGSKKLTDDLVPVSGRTLNMDTQLNVDLVAALSGLFNDPAKISENFREGMVANNFIGYESVFQNTHWPIHVTGTDDGTGDHLVDAADQTGSTITHGSEGTGTLEKGDIITFAGCNRVHPETKADTGQLMRFVVTADMTASQANVLISPEIVTSGALQNVAASPTNAGAITKAESGGDAIPSGATDAGDYQVALGYHRDAFAFATADLEMPDGVAFASRKVLDGISMRIVRQYDINNDMMPTRIDVLYGFKTLRPEMAVRYGFN